MLPLLSLLLLVAGLIFLIMLFVAPIKLYGIHREIRQTNELLKQQADLLAKIEERNHAQVRLLAAVANMAVVDARIPGPDPLPASPLK
jgi:hypothetical protein